MYLSNKITVYKLRVMLMYRVNIIDYRCFVDDVIIVVINVPEHYLLLNIRTCFNAHYKYFQQIYQKAVNRINVYCVPTMSISRNKYF